MDPSPRLTRDDYSYTPILWILFVIEKEPRRYETKYSEYKFVKIRGKDYAVKESSRDKLLIYDNANC